MLSPERARTAAILERGTELEACLRIARDVERREGALVLLDGPAGIGKTSLLHAVRDAALERGFTVLSATGSEPDRDFPFGMVHQLLDGALAPTEAPGRARLLTGAAALAEIVLAPTPADAPAQPSHAALHGLYWLCANLAEERPLLLLADDLHWADAPSLRFLEFLGRRLEGLPLLVLGAARSGEAGPAGGLLGLIARGPASRTLSPGPLSAHGVGQALAATLDTTPDPEFVAACAEATGGNPLLVRELARAAREQGLEGTAEDAPCIPRLAAAGVAGATRRRLRGLGPAATAVAAATTVLGPAPRPDDLAALTGLPEDEVAGAVDLLVRAEVLEPAQRSFVHPLVREALAGSIPPGERSRLHALAARRLAGREAPPTAVAVHLLACAPAGEPWVVEVLLRAARTAAAEGAGETAIAHLRRALAEPPPAAERPVLLLELGERRLAAGEAAGVEELSAALDGGLEGDQAARARAGRASVRLLDDPRAAVAELAAARAAATDAGLALRLEAIALEGSFYDARLAGERPGLLAGDAPSPVLLAHRAVDAAYTAQPAAAVVRSARGALDHGALLAALGPASPTVSLLALALRHAEEPVLAAGLLDAGEAEARRTGSHLARYHLNHAKACWHLAFGTLIAAEAHAREALDVVAAQPPSLARMAAAAVLAEVLLERGDVDGAAALLERHPIPPGMERTVAVPDHLAVRAAVRTLQRRPDDALADLRRAAEGLAARGWRVPLKGRVPLRLAEALAATGDRAAALAIVDAEEAAARARGARGTTGIVLRTRARVGPPDALEGVLADAETELRASALRLDLAWALLERAAAIRRAGRHADARKPLLEALDLAGRLGADRLAGLVRDELLAAGARPQRPALSGPESLTPSERRVAELAASGLSNREVAETLWVTRRTVELHLGRSCAKLGIRSRARLAEALGT